MSNVKIIDLKKSVLENNDLDADKLRSQNSERGIYYMNVMSSPGSGKTSSIVRIIEKLKDKLAIGVMEADIDSDVDAITVKNAGVESVQLHTGGMCHLDAEMSRQGIKELLNDDMLYAQDITEDKEHLDLVILENVGNLVCPAEFDTGANLDVAILSVPEGDDKPLKYPLMFETCKAVLINKIDSLPVFDFDKKKVEEYILNRNKESKIFYVSAKNDEGFDEFCDWLYEQVEATRRNK